MNTNIVPILDLWLEAGSELGYPSGDPNGFQREGNVKKYTQQITLQNDLTYDE